MTNSLVCVASAVSDNLVVVRVSMFSRKRPRSSHTSKHGDVLDVVKLAVAFTIKSGPEISNENLWSLHKPHSATFISGLISETGEMVGQQIDQFTSTAFSTFNELDNTSVKVLFFLLVIGELGKN